MTVWDPIHSLKYSCCRSIPWCQNTIQIIAVGGVAPTAIASAMESGDESSRPPSIYYYSQSEDDETRLADMEDDLDEGIPMSTSQGKLHT